MVLPFIISALHVTAHDYALTPVSGSTDMLSLMCHRQNCDAWLYGTQEKQDSHSHTKGNDLVLRWQTIHHVLTHTLV